jgi:monoamine oxidase
MSSESADILVIGAGAAGLAAAAELAPSGRSVLVLEARERTGGRVWSLGVPRVPVPVELGAEFIHGRPQVLFSLLRKAGLAAVDRTGSAWHVERGRLCRADGAFAEIRRAIRKARRPVKDVSFETYLEREMRRLSPRARLLARRRVEGYDAADPTRVSALAILAEWSGEDDAAAPSHFRPLGGYGAVLAALESALEGSCVEIRRETVVRSVRWERGRVEVEGTSCGASFRASAARAIITLPLGVLKLAQEEPNAVRFVPALAQKRKALDRLAPSPALKVVMRFSEPFWEKIDRGRYADAAFFRASNTAFPVFWTALPVRIPLLTAWAGGPHAERMANLDTEEIVARAVASAKTLFGARARIERRLEAAWVHDWQRDPFARGAYSYVLVSGGGARRTLALPIADTLFFAGEATDAAGEHGTVAGALQSGIRAAREALTRA